MDSTPSTRSKNRSPRASSASASAAKRSVAPTSGHNGAALDWVEPALASPVPSFEEHGGGPYGVLEDMQALGSRPSAKVKARVKADGPKKGAQNKSLANPQAAPSAQDTPEATPAPVDLMPEQPLVIVDDERDDDYTPRPSKKPAKSRLSRSAAHPSKPAAFPKLATPSAAASETPAPSSVATPTASATPAPPPTSAKRSSKAVPKTEQSTPAPVPTPASVSASQKHNLKTIIDAAVQRSIDVGNKYLGLAIQEVYLESQTKPHLTALLQHILDQTSSPDELTQFRERINQAKKKIKAQEAAEKVKSKEKKSTSSPAPEMIPRPSIETQPVQRKPKISLKIGKNTKPANKPASSPLTTKPRTSSVSSSSSLSSLTSIEESTPPPYIGRRPQMPDLTSRLAAPTEVNGSLKRSSVEAGNDENDRELQAKKQKFNSMVNRDAPTEESHVRPDLSAIPKVHKNLIVPPVQLTANGASSRDVSADVASPLTEMSSPLSSRRGTPKGAAMPAKLFKKKAKTKHSPVKKAPGQSADEDGTSRRPSPVAHDANEESDNNDFCAACNTSGYLLCCDGCDKSFHFGCLDPPLTQNASELDEPWYCFGCIAKREQPQRRSRGLFAPLLSNLDKRNPSVFLLPQEIRDYFDGVATTKDGRFVEQLATKTRRGAGWDELPDNFKTKDAKGQAILCYSCGLSSLGRREIITCDQCSAHWHLDCLDPPLANAPYRDHTGRKIRDWLCPLHVDHVLRQMDVPRLAERQLLRDRRVHMRRPRGAKVVDTALNRDFINDGVIEIAPDSSDEESEFYEEEVAGVVYRLPEKGIKLDFIDKVKRLPVPSYSRFTSARPTKRARLNNSEKDGFFQRSFLEQRTALDLVGLANQQANLDFNGDQVSNLLSTLIAEAPSDVVAQMVEADKSSSTAIPPSPPASDQQLEQNVAQQRKQLELLQTLISRRLADLAEQ